MGWEQYPWNYTFWPEEVEPEQSITDDVPPIKHENNSLESIASQKTLSFNELPKKQPFKKETRYDWGAIAAITHFAGGPVFGVGLMQFLLRTTKPYLSEDIPRWMPESLIAAGLGLMLGGAYFCIKSLREEQEKNRNYLSAAYKKNGGGNHVS